MSENTYFMFYLIDKKKGTKLLRRGKIIGNTFEWNWGWAEMNKLQQNDDKKSRVLLKYVID